MTYSDVQKYLKLLRRHRYQVRYFVTGEYGSKGGRAHWHIVLHFYERLPLYEKGVLVESADMSPVPKWAGWDQRGQWVENGLSKPGQRGVKRFDHVRVDADGEPVLVDGEPAYWWPHGFTQVTDGTSAANIRYNCKYVAKDLRDAEAQGFVMMSKKPPLGARYFEARAAEYAKAYLAPQDLFYSWPDVRRDSRKKGRAEIIQFMLNGVSAGKYLDAYVDAWAALHPERERPYSELVERWVEYGVLREPDYDESPSRWGEWDRRQRDKVKVRLAPGETPFYKRDDFASPGARERELFARMDAVPRGPDVGRAIVRKPRVDQLRGWMSVQEVRWNKVTFAWEAPGPVGRSERYRWEFIQRKGGYGWRKVTENETERVWAEKRQPLVSRAGSRS